MKTRYPNYSQRELPITLSKRERKAAKQQRKAMNCFKRFFEESNSFTDDYNYPDGVTNGSTELFAGVRESFAGVRDSFAGVREPFAGVRDSFAGVRDSFAGVRNSFAGVRDSFAGVREPFAGVRESLIGTIPIFIMAGMHRDDYIPEADNKFDALQKGYMQILVNHHSEMGLTLAEIQPLIDLADNWDNKWAIARLIDVRHSETVAKNRARNLFEPAIRLMTKKLKLNDLAKRFLTGMGIHIDKTFRTSSVTPSSAPSIQLVSGGGNLMKLYYGIAQGDDGVLSRGKLKGASMIQYRIKFSIDAPTDYDDYDLTDIASRNHVNILFKLQQKGLKMWITARWGNVAGWGPWSNYIYGYVS